jgi:hypothetical protein
MMMNDDASIESDATEFHSAARIFAFVVHVEYPKGLTLCDISFARMWDGEPGADHLIVFRGESCISATLVCV